MNLIRKLFMKLKQPFIIFLVFLGVGLFVANCKTQRHVKTIRALIVLPSLATIEADEDRQFQATLIYSDGTREKVTDQVEWFSSNTSVATISSQSGITSGQADGVDIGQTTITAQLDGLTSTPSTLTVVGIDTKKSYAYIVNSNIHVTNNSTIMSCLINNADGTFGTCDTNTDPSFENSAAIALNPAGTYAYIVNKSASSLSICSINQESGKFDSCTVQKIPGFFNGNQPNAIAFDEDPSQNNLQQLYIGAEGYNSPLNTCRLNSAGTLIERCSPVNTWEGGVFFLGRTLSATNTYISSFNFSGIAVCPQSGACSSAIPPTPGFRTEGIIIHSQETYAYYVNSFKQVEYCPINSSNGTFTNCDVAISNSGTTSGWTPFALAFKESSSNFYVTSITDVTQPASNPVFYCTGGNPASPTCTVAGTGFLFPVAIAITP